MSISRLTTSWINSLRSRRSTSRPRRNRRRSQRPSRRRRQWSPQGRSKEPIMKMFKILLAVFIAMYVLMAPTQAMARNAHELRARFEQRFTKIKALKGAGKIGETSSGMLEAVKGGLSDEERRLVDEDNADRTELYALIAKQEGVSPQVVAERNAKRNFERASDGEYLKDEKGWYRKGER